MNEMKIYLSTPPELAAEALLHAPVSVMAYRVGRSFQLMRTRLPQGRFDVMDVDCTGFTGFGPHEALAAQIMRECRLMRYSGVSMGLGRPTPQLAAFAQRLALAAARTGVELYMPASYAGAGENVILLTTAQNLSGTYALNLRELCARYGAGRIALELERVRTDFALPARSGRGTILSEGGISRLPPSPAFYSRELEANYMTYISSGRAHLVIWDDLESITAKLRTAAKLGIGRAFFYYPHVRDIVDKIMQ